MTDAEPTSKMFTPKCSFYTFSKLNETKNGKLCTIVTSATSWLSWYFTQAICNAQNADVSLANHCQLLIQLLITYFKNARV